jgi:hypothetical protein
LPFRLCLTAYVLAVQTLTIKHSKAKTVAVSAVDTTSHDKMAKAELSRARLYLTNYGTEATTLRSRYVA